MEDVVNYVTRVLYEENGSDMVEYGLLASFISIASLVTIRLIGPLVNALFVVVHDTING